MRGIPIYEADADDYATNGLGLLSPTECTVEEVANGMYELTLVQPITNNTRWDKVINGRILKAACPVRESPIYEINIPTETVATLQIYKVNTSSSRLRLRQLPSLDAKTLSYWPKGTEVIYLDQPDNNWTHVTVRDGGQTGYMWTGYLRYDRDITQTITTTNPVGTEGVQITISRDQLFRIYSVENDTKAGLQTVKAMHVFYDLRNTILGETYELTDESAEKDAATAAMHVMNNLVDETDFTLYCNKLTGDVLGQWDWCTPVDAWLNETDGILTQVNGMLFRDNFDIFMLPDTVRDLGVTIRRGKNLIGVTVSTDMAEVVTRIIPCGQASNGDPLFLANGKDKDGYVITGGNYIESPRVDNYPQPVTRKNNYSVKVNSKGDFKTETAARTELERLAYEEFANGCDVPDYNLDVDFILLDENIGEDLSDWVKLQAVHMFDRVTVIDETIGLSIKARVIGYVWDVLSEQYESITLQNVGGDNEASGNILTRPETAMTAATSAGCTVTASSTWSDSYAAYKAFDFSTSDSWASARNESNPWIALQMDVALSEIHIYVYSRTSQYVHNPTAGTVEGSNDGSNWTQIGTFSGWKGREKDALLGVINCANETAYSHVRINITSHSNYNDPESDYVAIGYITISGKEGVST